MTTSFHVVKNEREKEEDHLLQTDLSPLKKKSKKFPLNQPLGAKKEKSLQARDEIAKLPNRLLKKPKNWLKKRGSSDLKGKDS